MNIIFLDIDGVLNSLPYSKQTNEELNPYTLTLLSKIYHKYDCQIVLASTWRELKDIPECADVWNYLIDNLQKYDMKIFDITPMINNNRPKEIAEWLKNHSWTNYVILDDDFPIEDYKKHHLDKHLIKTIFFTDDISEGGLQEKHVKQAIKIFESSEIS